MRPTLEQMAKKFDPNAVPGWDVTVSFDLTGEGGGQYHFKIADGKCTLADGPADAPELTIHADAKLWESILAGTENAQSAFLSGELKVDGDLTAIMDLARAFGLQ